MTEWMKMMRADPVVDENGFVRREGRYTRGRTWNTYYSSLKVSMMQIRRDYNRDYAYRISSASFPAVLEVPGFLNRIHKSEPDLQLMIFKEIHEGACPYASAVRLQLIHENGIDSKELNHFDRFGPESMLESHTLKILSPHTSLAVKLKHLSLHLYSSRESWGRFGKMSLNDDLLVLLAGKHGEEIIATISNKIYEQNASLGHYQLALLVENWEKYKNYPINWSLTMLEDHDCQNADNCFL